LKQNFVFGTPTYPHLQISQGQEMQQTLVKPINHSPRLCTGVFKTCADTNIPPVVFMGQILTMGMVSYAWVDGLSETNPILIPIEQVSQYHETGTLDTFLSAALRRTQTDVKFAPIEQKIKDLFRVGQSNTPPLSAVTLARAIQFLFSDENLSATQALSASHQWAETVIALHQAENSCFELLINKEI
jgi:hypothetical protein